MKFSDLGLSQPILRALDAAGYQSPTPVQAQAIPHVLQGRDLFGCAQTGTGKTAAFALPILERLAAAPKPNGKPHGKSPVRVLVLTPTRELASQIGASFEEYGKHLPFRSAVVFGGVNIGRQIQTLARGPEIVIATPGRLIDLMQQRAISLADVHTLVLDEADRMLDLGFVNDVMRIARTLPKTRQTLLFSATIPSRIRELAQSLLASPVHIAVDAVSSAAETLDQSVYFVDKSDKRALLAWVLQNLGIERTLAFTRTKRGADRVVEFLQGRGFAAAALHGNKSQNARERALDAFKRGKLHVLVATDIAARGIDIDQLSHVINYELPNTAESYVHRIGRSGRAGASGAALSFCDVEELPLFRSIERLIQAQIRVVDDHPHVPPAGAVANGNRQAPQPRGGQRDGQRGGRGDGRQQQGRQQQGRQQQGRQQQGRHAPMPAHAARSSEQPQQRPPRRDPVRERGDDRFVVLAGGAADTKTQPVQPLADERPLKPGYSRRNRRGRAFAR